MALENAKYLSQGHGLIKKEFSNGLTKVFGQLVIVGERKQQRMQSEDLGVAKRREIKCEKREIYVFSISQSESRQAQE